MNKIKQLDDTIANKIAAGEVIERPANVVKELVENSIDAYAQNIQIEIKLGGIEEIKITDDGEGMSFGDAKLCFSRHATSKITDDHDLFDISTLGFRGEAIPSIASISHFDLHTSNSVESTHIIYEYGKQTTLDFEERKQGTTITITHLFQNVPARLKYLKAPTTEFAVIYTYVERLALAHSSISFRLIHDGSLVFQTPGNGNLLEVIGLIYGHHVAKEMKLLHYENDNYHFYGYVSGENLSRSSKNHIITFINKRYVRSKFMIDCIDTYYARFLPEKRHPIVVIHLNIDPYLVDVNVHPAKLEVRFSNEEDLKKYLYSALDDIFLKKEEIMYTIEKEKPIIQELQEKKKDDIKTDIINYHKPQFQSGVLIEEESFDKSYHRLFDEKKDVQKDIKEVKKPILNKVYVIGKAQDNYILCENERGLYLVNMYYACQRIYYNYYRDIYKKKAHYYQSIVPFTLDYTESEVLFIQKYILLLEQLGIKLELHGKTSFQVREIPVWMNDLDPHFFIEDIINELMHHHFDILELEKKAILTLMNLKIKTKGYQSHYEMQELMDELMRQTQMHTPNGQPIYILYSQSDLQKLFKKGHI